ncbi:MAG: M56 family metallopeptidase [Oscillospiraceae bacterium]
MREAFFALILPASIAGSVLYLLFLLLRPLIKKQQASFYKRSLLLSAVAFIIPFPLLLSFFSLLLASAGGAASPSVVNTTFKNVMPTAPAYTVGQAFHAASAGSYAVSPAFSFSSFASYLPFILAFIYFIGVLALNVYYCATYLAFCFNVKRSVAPCKNTAASAMLSALCDKYGIKRTPQLRQSAFVSCPVLIGFARPQIILPKQALSDKDLNLALRHELLHLKHHDLWAKVLVLFITALHWFNPLVYLLKIDFEKAMEATCDERLLKRCNTAERKYYAGLLLSFAGNNLPYTVSAFPPLQNA